MAINSARKSDFVEYSCHVISAEDVLVKKNFTLKQVIKIDLPISLTRTTFMPLTYNKKLPSNLKPKVRIIPIEKDLREGGKVALECESG